MVVMSSSIKRVRKRIVDNDNISGRCLVEYDPPRMNPREDGGGQRTRRDGP